MGRVPDAGLHRDEARTPRWSCASARMSPSACSRPMRCIPRWASCWDGAGSRVAAIIGLPPTNRGPAQGGGCGSRASGSVAMFHVVGSTPEAPTLEAALGGASRRSRRHQAGRAARGRDALTSVGPPALALDRGRLARDPHASLAELREIAALLGAGIRPTASSCWSRPPATCCPRRRPTAPRNGCAPPAWSCWSTRAATWDRSSAHPAADHDRLGQVGLVRAGQHRCPGHLRVARGVRALGGGGRLWRDASLWGDA